MLVEEKDVAIITLARSGGEGLLENQVAGYSIDIIKKGIGRCWLQVALLFTVWHLPQSYG